MKNYKPITAVLLTFLLLSCGDSAEEEVQTSDIPVESKIGEDTQPAKETTEVAKPEKDTHVKLSNTEDKLIDQVWQLPEVKVLSEKIARESKGSRQLVGRVSSKPSDDQEYYGISISEDNGEAMATYFEFRIYPDNSIYFYDVVEDKELTLKEWRTRKK